MADKKTKKAKAAENTHEKDKFSISITYRFWIWAAIWVAGLIFTQALRAPASSIFFGFVSIVPWASLAYALIAKATLKIFMLSDTTVTEKNKPFTYEFRIINEAFLPFPFIDAYIKLPRRSSVRTSERCVRVGMPPMSNYTVKGTVKFRFRGTYEIGVTSFYVYDFFRIFRVRSHMGTYSTVYVLPRKLVLDTSDAFSVSDSALRTVKAPYVYDRLEVSDIRDYMPGDSLKSIHWKLSSKSEEFIVNDYNTGSADVSYIFCDMSAHFPDEAPEKPFVNPFENKEEEAAASSGIPADENAPADDVSEEESVEAAEEKPAEAEEKPAKKKKKNKKKTDDPAKPDIHALINDEAYEDMNEYCADGAIELTIAVILRELRSGRDVTLMWYDDRSEIGAFVYDLHTVEDFDLIFRLFASAPTVHSEKKISRLAASAGDTKDSKVMIVLPVLDEESVDDICEIPRISEIIAYSAEDRFLYPELRRNFIDDCREQFSARGIKLIDGKLDEEKILATESALEGGEEEKGGTVGVGPIGKKE